MKSPGVYGPLIKDPTRCIPGFPGNYLALIRPRVGQVSVGVGAPPGMTWEIPIQYDSSILPATIEHYILSGNTR